MLLQYLVEGAPRDLMIILEELYIVILIELAIIFIYQSIKKKEKMDLNLAWGIFFACFGVVATLVFYQNFFMSEEIWATYEQIYKLFSLIPLLTMMGIMEYISSKYRPKTFFILTIFGGIVGITVIYTPGLFSQALFMIFSVLLIIFGILFFRKLISITSGAVKKNMKIFMILLICLLGLDTFKGENAIRNVNDLGVNVPLYITIIWLLQIASVLGLALVLFKIPIFLELDWRENLIQIFIIHKYNSVLIFHTKFHKSDSDPGAKVELNEDLVAGGMIGISTMLKEISRSSQDLKIIDHGDQQIMLEHSQHIFIALNVKKPMKIYWEKIKQLSTTIEQFYFHILEKWDGSLDYFKPLDGIVKKLFE